MRRTIQITIIVVGFFVGLAWFCLDIIGRGQTAIELPEKITRLAKLLAAQQGLGYTIGPWIVMGLALLFLSSIHWLPILVNQLKGRGRNRVDNTLLERCSRFSEELARFVADRRQNNPSWTSHRSGQKAMHKAHEESTQYSVETMAKYIERFSGEALYVADKAIEFGIIKASERPRFQFPTNPLGVEHVSQEISAICLKLNEKLR